MEFDRFSIALMILRPDAPQHTEEEANALQDAHMAHLADLKEAGHLLAAGPLDDPHYRGLSILAVDADRARELKEADPAVEAGRFEVKVIPWLVPEGVIAFPPARLPRSLADLAD